MTEFLNALMLAERSLWQAEHPESANGFRPWRFYAHGLEFALRVPRTRQRNFYPTFLACIRNEDEERAHLFTLIYAKSLTDEQIGEVTQEIYGRHYSKQQISYLTNLCREEVLAWLERDLYPRYLEVFIDSTFSPTRRDGQVRREAYYTILGTLPDGTREVLGIVNHPTEGARNWRQELQVLQGRGLQRIDVIVSYALVGI